MDWVEMEDTEQRSSKTAGGVMIGVKTQFIDRNQLYSSL